MTNVNRIGYKDQIINDIIITSTDDSSSILTGAFTCAGGVGIVKKVFIGETLNIDGDIVPLNTGDKIITGSIGAGGDLILRSTTNGVKGNVYIDEVTDSTTTSDGSLVVAGGVGIAKKLFIGTTLNLTGDIVPLNAGDKIITGSTGAGGDLILRSTTDGVKGNVYIDEVTDSTTISTGALVVDGGVGIAKKLFVGTDLSVSGNILNVPSYGIWEYRLPSGSYGRGWIGDDNWTQAGGITGTPPTGTNRILGYTENGNKYSYYRHPFNHESVNATWCTFIAGGTGLANSCSWTLTSGTYYINVKIASLYCTVTRMMISTEALAGAVLATSIDTNAILLEQMNQYDGHSADPGSNQGILDGYISLGAPTMFFVNRLIGIHNVDTNLSYACGNPLGIGRDEIHSRMTITKLA